jgi:hypothetical protein
MPSHAEVEATQSVTRQTVPTALEDNGLWPIPFHDTLNDRLKDALVGDIIDTISEREVDRIVFSLANADIAQFAGSGKVFSILVKGHCHHSISRVERLFDAITMVDINVDI